jgi:DNA polymerase I
MKFLAQKYIQIYGFNEAYKTFTLNEISKAILKEEKIEIKSFEEQTYEELAKYCLHDSELLFKLMSFDNKRIWKFLILISRYANLPIREVCRASIGQIVKSAIWFQHRRKNYLIPKEKDFEEKNKAKILMGKTEGKFKGAIVECNPGFYENVKILDFNSQYPSIIDEKNIGYSSVICPHPECKTNIVPEHDFHICTKRKDIVSALVGSLKDLRIKYFKKEEPTVASVLKVILNAQYGIFLDIHQKDLCVLPVGSAITAYGRQTLEILKEQAEQAGAKIISLDTDGAHLVNLDNKQIQELTRNVQEKTGIELGIDEEFKFAIYSRKKHYIGITEDGKVIIKGMTGKKFHVCPLFKKAFREILEILKNIESKEDGEKIKKQITQTVKKYCNIIKNEEYELKDLIFKYKLKKERSKSEHDQKYIVKKLYKEFLGRETNYIEIILTSGKYSACPPELIQKLGLKVNKEKYLELLGSTLNQILEILNLDFDKIISGQSSFEDFIN